MGSAVTMEAKKRASLALVPAREAEPRRGFQIPSHAESAPAAGHDFAQVSVLSEAARPTVESCPLRATPSLCPFGGACHTCPTHVQRKLAIGEAGDEYEREADSVARQVVRSPARSLRSGDRDGSRVVLSREVAADRTPGGLNGLPLLSAQRGAGRPLPASLREEMEQEFGADFSLVQLHTDPPAQQIAASVGARAFTCGNHIFLGPGQREADRYLMAHELAHTLQQAGRPSGPRPQTPPVQSGPSAIALGRVPVFTVQRDIDYPGGSGREIGQIMPGAWYEADVRLDNVRQIHFTWSEWPNGLCECKHEIKVRVEEYSSVGVLGALNIYDYYEWYWWNHEYFCTSRPEGACPRHHLKEGPQSAWKGYDEKDEAPKSDTDVLSLIGSIASILGLAVAVAAAIAEAEPRPAAEGEATARA